MGDVVRLMIIEDCESHVEAILHEMRLSEFDPIWILVESEPEFLATVEGTLDIVLSAFSIQQFNAMRALELLRSRGLEIPFIIVSETIGEEAVVSAMKMGAKDYVHRDRLGRLGTAIRRSIEERRCWGNTDHKCAEEEIRNSESSLRLLALELQAETRRLVAAQAVAKVGSWETDLKTLTVVWSAETYRIFGVDQVDFLPTHDRFLSLVHPDDRRRVDGEFRESILSKQSCAIEHRLLLRDGMIKFVEEHWQIICDDCEQPLYAIGTCQDISERRQAELETRRVSDLLNAVTDQSPDAMFVKDRQGRYLLFNRAATRFVGRDATDVIGRDDIALFDHAGAFRVMERDQRVMASGVAEVQEEELTAAGITRIYLATKAPFVDGQGNIVGVVGISSDITERKRIEQQLRVNEAKLAEAIRIAQLGYWSRDLTTDEMECSDELHDIFGIDRQAFGRTFEAFLAVVYHEDRDTVRATIDGAREHFSHTYRIVVQGEIRAIHEMGDVISANDGTRVRIAGTAQDVTDQWKVKNALRASEERLLHILLNSPFPAMVHTDDGEVLLLSHSWTDITGYSKQELPTLMSWTKAAYGDRHGSHLAMITASCALNSRQNLGETQPRTKTGKLLTWDFWATPLGTLPDGRRFFLWMAVDITDWKGAQESLRLRDRALQAVSQGILITDARQQDNPIIYASPSVEKLTGYSPAEVLGRNCRFLGGAATDSDATEKLRRAVEQGQSCSVELVNYRKDGIPFWNAVSVSPIHDDEGTLTHFVGSQADVTERLKLEHQLHQMQKMEAMGRLAGGIAHDFNNLLTIINGYGDLLVKQLSKDDPRAAFAEQIKIAGDRATGLTQQLLAFSRRQVVQPISLDLNTVIASLEDMLKRLIGEDIEIVFKLKSNPPTIKADRGQMEQVLLNLCLNARDAMPLGGMLTIETAAIEIDNAYAATHPGACPGPHLMVAVSDSGCGMEKWTLSQVFEPFFTTKSPSKGTGLGLATVYGIVSQSGGHIEVYSELDLGTTFKVYLPSRPGEAEPMLPPVAEPAERSVGTETILLVEDEAGVRALAVRFLTECGYRVLEASRAEEALKAYAERPSEVHLVITDVVMPGMSGREMVEQLRKQSPELKVIYMSAYTEDAIVRNGVLRSACDFLQKPFTSNALAAKVREVLNRE